jgi:hypothetical protein
MQPEDYAMNSSQDRIAGTEEDYQQLVAEMVAEETPALFAVVEDLEDRSDGRIAAWMLKFPDRAEVITTDGCERMRVSSAERALAIFGRLPGVSARLIQTGCPER